MPAPLRFDFYVNGCIVREDIEIEPSRFAQSYVMNHPDVARIYCSRAGQAKWSLIYDKLQMELRDLNLELKVRLEEAP